MDIPPGAAELFHADRRRDMTKLTVAFRNFWERAYPKKKKKTSMRCVKNLNTWTHFSVLSYVEKFMWKTAQSTGRGHFCNIVMRR